MTQGMRDWIREVGVVLLVVTRTNDYRTDGWTLFPNDATFRPAWS
jgi:acetolactate synthase-1/2/3 large subunit